MFFQKKLKEKRHNMLFTFNVEKYNKQYFITRASFLDSI